MADNTQIIGGGSGDIIRDILRPTGAKTQVVQLDVGGQQAEALVGPVPAGFGNVPVSVQDAQDGVRQIEILAQILLELKILNQQIYALPSFLTAAQTLPPDAPESFRNDPSIFNQ